MKQSIAADHPRSNAELPTRSLATPEPVPAMNSATAGNLIVISGPSGAGKTTLLRKLFEHCPGLRASVSATTRPPRPGERDGVDYHFLSPAEFERRRLAGEFLACCEVFGRGHWYGTLQSEVTPSLQAGKSIVLEIDVQGALAVLESYPQAITIFVRPSSPEELERRLRGRGTDSEEAIRRRLEVARRELECANRYQYQVTNDDVDRAVQEICDIIRSREV
jgi:guanylate kinase